ncbi:MAG: aspartate--tRNA(Asn) ligase [Spirochaetales bacterium]|nr:aspartate--tRNA(Asn) ligase [Spirochaetales bacterium]MCF7937842.1 aspartate--tRNA(Asn) ligase [Spirochaetales bacterium]
MSRTMAADIKRHTGKEVELSGWVHRLRDLGGVTFLILRDRSGSVQTVWDKLPELTPESVIRVYGTVVENEAAPGGMEVQGKEFTILSQAEGNLPFAVPGDHTRVGIDVLLDNRMLSLRNPKLRSIFTIQSDILDSFARYLRGLGFTEIKSSKLISSGSEGGTGLFPVEYFETQVFLAQSPQLYKQAMVAAGMERVFEIGAAYRAEKHETARHLNEYVSLDVEMGFIESDQELMDLEVGILQAVCSDISEKNPAILEDWGASVPTAQQLSGIPRIPYDRALSLLSDRLDRRVFELTPEGERELCSWAKAEAGIDAVFVHSFPRKKRPFYTFPNGRKTMSFDLLFRGLEITSGGRRINDYSKLTKNIVRSGLDPVDMEDYLSVFRYGCPPHGGFAIGLERLTQQLLGLANIKEASLFPRDRRRIRP